MKDIKPQKSMPALANRISVRGKYFECPSGQSFSLTAKSLEAVDACPNFRSKTKRLAALKSQIQRDMDSPR